MRNISIKAVVLGFTVTLLLDALVGVAVMFLFGRGVFQTAISEADAIKALATISQQTSFLLVSLGLGTLTTVAGGYVCARVAKRLPYMNTAALGMVGLLFGFLLADASIPLWFNVLAFVFVMPSSLLGGFFAKRYQPAGA